MTADETTPAPAPDEPVLPQPDDGSTQLDKIREEKARMSLEAEAKMQAADAPSEGEAEAPEELPVDDADDDAANDDDADTPTQPFSFTTHAQAQTAVSEYGVDTSEIEGWINMSVKQKSDALNEYFDL